MKYEERRKWIANYLLRVGSVDILCADFVDEYIEATKAKYQPTFFGAFKCRRLSNDLRRMHDEGFLRRSVYGLGAGWHSGFPKWVHSYRLYNQDVPSLL